MQPLPHHYQVSAQSDPSSLVSLNSNQIPKLISDAPREFGGGGQNWSPETLLCASIADCFILTFKAIAQASKFQWQHLECTIIGTLEKNPAGSIQFTHFELNASLCINQEANPEQADRLLHKAEGQCLISNSLNCDVHLSTDVVQK